jgi:hypothetical protein
MLTVWACTTPIMPGSDAGPMRVDTGPRPDAGGDSGVGPADAGGDANTVDIDSGITDAGLVCVAPEEDCGGTCVNTSTSAAHCGGCDMPCVSPTGGTTSCSAGDCVPACPGGLTLCGTACTNLETDVDNCGACGYRVVSAGRAGEASLRTCVDGQPSPGWVPISTSGAPPMQAELLGVTEQHLLHIDRASTRLYDFASDTWAPSMGAPPFAFPTIDTSPTRCGGQAITGISLHDRNEYFVWFTSGAYRFIDDGTPRWQPVTTTGISTSYRDWNTMAYDGTHVFVMLGAAGCNGTVDPAYSAENTSLQYDMDAAAWHVSPYVSNTWCGSNTTHSAVDMPFAWANDLLAGLGGTRANTGLCATSSLLISDPSTDTWSTGPDSLTGGSVRGHTFISIGDRIFATASSTTGWIMDPRGASTPVTPPPGPAGPRLNAYSMFTGRSLIYWGGYQAAPIAGGQIGVVALTPSPSIVWRPLPTAGEPSASSMEAVSRNAYSGQSLWTGHEAVVAPSALGTRRARFQPPVGCVCPAISGWSYSPACEGVTGTIPTSCAPM